MSGQVLPASREPYQLIDPNEQMISEEQCVCRENDSDCSCPNMSSSSRTPKNKETDLGPYRVVGGVMALVMLFTLAVAHFFRRRSDRREAAAAGKEPPPPPPLLMIYAGFLSLKRLFGRKSADVVTQPNESASTTPPYTTSAIQRAKELIDNFNLNAGRHIPSYDTVEARLRHYYRMPLSGLSQNARQFYVQAAIDEFVQRIIDRYDFATAANTLWHFDLDSYTSRYPLLLQDDLREAERRATGYTRIAQEYLAGAITVDAKETAVRAQFERHFTNGAYLNNYLGSMALRTWNELTTRQRSWFIAQTIPELITNLKKGELPPLFIKWFIKNVRPKLAGPVTAHLDKAWAAIPENFRNAMGNPEISSDAFPAVFYEMMLQLDPTFEISFPKILGNEAAFADALENARIAVVRSRGAVNGGGSNGGGGAPSSGTSGSGGSAPVIGGMSGETTAGLSAFSILGRTAQVLATQTLFTIEPLIDSANDIFIFRSRSDDHTSIRPVPWQNGSMLRRLPYVPQPRIEVDDDPRWRETNERRDVPTRGQREQDPAPQRSAQIRDKIGSVNNARGTGDDLFAGGVDTYYGDTEYYGDAAITTPYWEASGEMITFP